MKNFWTKLSNARKISYQLQKKYFDKKSSKKNPLEIKITNDLHKHPLYTSDMFLKIIWGDDKKLLWIQVGTDKGVVPR